MACFRAHAQEQGWAIFLAIIESLTMFSQPVLLRFFVKWLEDVDESVRPGLLLAMGLTLASLSQAVVHHVLYFVNMRMGWNLRTGMMGFLHHKLLRLAGATVSQFGSGKIINLISTDVLR